MLCQDPVSHVCPSTSQSDHVGTDRNRTGLFGVGATENWRSRRIRVIFPEIANKKLSKHNIVISKEMNRQS